MHSSIKIACFCTIIGVAWGKWKIPLFDKTTGTIQQCNSEYPCPDGYVCLSDPEVAGESMCYKGVAADAKVTKGSCPKTPQPDQVSRGNRCTFDSDCGKGMKCCKSSSNWWGSACVKPDPIPQDPTITILMNGTYKLIDDGKGYKFWASLVLIQSKGKNIIFDTGTVGQKIPLINQLSALAGLAPKDIDFVVTSHGHPDHISNGNIFTDIPNNFDTFTAINSNYGFNPLGGNKTYYVLDDKNLQLIFTPGHTLQDTSLVIRNVKGFGTVVAAADLVLKEGDTKASKQWSEDDAKFEASSKVIYCTADWIIPGHGTFFKVSAADKKQWKC